MGARWYNPDAGRFVSEDPISDGTNWYEFAGNDPVNYADPTGLSQAGHPLAALNANYGGFSGNKVAKYTPPPTAAAAIKPFSYNTATGKIGGANVLANPLAKAAPKSVNDFSAFGTASSLASGAKSSLDKLSSPPQPSPALRTAVTQAGGLASSQYLQYLDDRRIVSKLADYGQGALDVVGSVPVLGEPVDLINGGISLLRGDKTGAALSLASTIPVVGDIFGKGGKAARALAKAEDAAELARTIDIVRTARAAEKAEQGRNVLGQFVGKNAGELAPGATRQQRVQGKLAGKFGDDAVQAEQYLRTANGKIAIDPVTGEARRIDFAVAKNGKAVGTVEVTSKTANKGPQSAKELSIRQNGGTYILDKTTGQLIDFSNARQITSRRQ